MADRKLRVVIADDEPIVRSLFRHLLEEAEDIEIVAEVDNGAQAVRECQASRPDVVLMDISMPVMDGIEATRQLTKLHGTVPKILVLTGFEADDLILEALRAGAGGFLHKERSVRQIANAIRVVAEGDALVAPSVTKRLVAKASRRSSSKDVYSAAAVLTTRELEVLQLMGKGLSNFEIAGKLSVAETTVRTHVGHILMKLNLRDRVQAVVYAYEHGIVRTN